MDAGQGLSDLGLDAESAANLAAAYEATVSILSLNDHVSLPPASRAALLQAMLHHGRVHGFDENRLALAGLASAPRFDPQQGALGLIPPSPGHVARRCAAFRRSRGIQLPRQST